MWVEGGDIHDELLDRLDPVLAPPGDLGLTPSAAELEALAAAVAAQWPGGAVAPGEDPVAAAPGDTPGFTGSPVRRLRPAGSRPLRRLGSSAWRAGSVAAGIVVLSASAAAAANGGVPLPRPVRVVAYTVGLPVDSPALDDTNQHIKDLKDAVKANDKPKAEATARRLRTDLTKVPNDEKKEAVQKVAAVMVAAKPLIESPASTTTTTAPSPNTTATVPAPAPSTTATTAEEREKEKERDKGSVTTTTAGAATTTTTAPEATTTTTAPESTSSTTAPDAETTTTTTGPPVEETTTTTGPAESTTTTTTSTTTTTTAPPQPAGDQ